MCKIHGRNIKLVLEYNSVWPHVDPITEDVEKFNHLRPSRLYDSTYRFAVRFNRISSDIALRFFFDLNACHAFRRFPDDWKWSIGCASVRCLSRVLGSHSKMRIDRPLESFSCRSFRFSLDTKRSFASFLWNDCVIVCSTRLIIFTQSWVT